MTAPQTAKLTAKLTVTTTIGRTLTGVAAAAAIWTASIPTDHANAQSPYCGQRNTMVSALGKKFKETRRGIGIVSNKRMIELYVSGGGSWTVLFTDPKGMSCIGATGKNWEALSPMEVPVPGAQSSFSGENRHFMR